MLPTEVGVVHGGVVESIVEERVKVGSEAGCNEFNVPAFDCHHEGRHPCVSEHIVFQLFDRHQLIEGLQISGATREVDGRAAIIVRQIDIGAERDNLGNVSGGAFACHEHQRGDVSILDRLVYGEQLLENLDDRLDLAFVDGGHYDSLRAEALVAAVFDHFRKLSILKCFIILQTNSL